jgi:hypothetical protein
MFSSPTHGELDLLAVRDKILDFCNQDKESEYELIIGTDSQPHNGTSVDFVNAIVVHRSGHGGVYFWRKTVKEKHYVLRDRMYEEATMSLELAGTLLALFEPEGIAKFNIEIHVDIGTVGKTKDMITEIVGMILGNGYKVRIKPESYAASKVADRYT